MARRPLSLGRMPVGLEPLEGRTHFATHLVPTYYRWWNALRDTIRDAAPGDTVDFSAFRGTLAIDTAYAIDKDLTLVGPGPDRLTFTGQSQRVFEIGAGLNVSIKGVRIDDGTANDPNGGGGILVGGDVNSPRGTLALTDVTVTDCVTSGTGYDAGVRNGGGLVGSFVDLTLTRCHFAGNTAASSNSGAGGAIYLNNASLVAVDSTFDHNTARATGDYPKALHDSTALGGAIALVGADRSSFTNCTFANNAADSDIGTASDSFAEAHGGGLFVTADADLTIVNCTFAGNTAGGTGATGFGGGLDVLAFGLADPSPAHTLKVVNTVLAGNTAAVGPDAFGLDVTATAFANLKNNVIGDGTHGGVSNTVNGNRVGTANSPVNARLNALADNGGPVPTMMPQANSPVLGVASAAESATHDARRYPRSGPFDVGAVERQDNYAPSLTAWPADFAAANVPFASTLGATDVDGDAIALTLVNGPAWLTFVDHGNGTATLGGTPGVFDGGPTQIVVRSGDGRLSHDEAIDLGVYVEPVTLDSAGVLRVVGTDAGEVIKVYQPRGTGGAVRVSIGKRTRNYAFDAVKAIQIFGLGGDDVIVGNPADLGVYVNSGDGNDTVVGGNNVDSLTAAAGDDEVHGMGGNDWIDGNGGRDRLYAGDGDDRVYGGNGNDTLDGGAGRDVLYGEVGSNLYLTADRTRDRVFATNAASNFVQGDPDRDILVNAVPLPVVAATPPRKRRA